MPSSPAAIRSRSPASAGTYRRQYATWNGTPAAAAACTAARVCAAVTPHGFSHRIGRPRAATSEMISPCWSLGAVIRTPSTAAPSSIGPMPG